MAKPLMEFADILDYDEPTECFICCELRTEFVELNCEHSCCSICMETLYENELAKFIEIQARIIRDYEDRERRIRELRERRNRELERSSLPYDNEVEEAN